MDATDTAAEEKTLASVRVGDPGSTAEIGACDATRPEEPCTIVILGATGDLTARKLMPALFHLFLNGDLPHPVALVGCGRTRLDDVAFRERMRTALGGRGQTPSRWEEFAERLYYRPISYDDPSSFEGLGESLEQLDRRCGTGGNRIFYLALPPSLYKTVARNIGRAGLGQEGVGGNGWSRLVVEKPFGRDLETAIALDRAIAEHFQEHQVFRLDHYLAKETVQNVLMFRFANAIFEPVWNRRYVDHVKISAAETVGVGHRAGYYEQAGVLRDMFQNHMLQVLALISMEPPSRFEADQVRSERMKVFRALRPFPAQRYREFLQLGQYTAGTVDGRPVPAYRDEPDVPPDSLIPTYARMKVYIDNWRWQGVPFILTSGKRLEKKVTEIVIQFKEVPHSMFRRVLGQGISANRLTIGIYPDETISLTFQTKNPGARVCLRTVTMDFHYQDGTQGPLLDAYEKVLGDCMLGDQMLFWHQNSVEQAWKFLTPVLDGCERCSDRAGALEFYPAGSQGPRPAAGMTLEGMS